MAVSRTIPTQANPDLLTFSIKIEGEAISREYHIGRISIKKEVNKIATASIGIFDGNPAEETFAASDTDLFIPGKNIEISLGYHSQETTVFSGIIVSHSNKITSSSSELDIECKDAAVKMTIGRHSKHYNEVTDGDVAEELIGKYAGITADVQAATIQHKDLVQYDTTDWDFMVARMDSIGFITLVSDGTVTIKKPALGEPVTLDVLFGATILDYTGTIDARYQYLGVQAITWNFSDQQRLETDAAEPGWEEGGDISNADLAETIGLEQYKLIHPGKLNQEELQAWADARLMKNRLSKIRGTVKFQGTSEILPGDFIGLNGVGNRFSGKAIVSAIHHECTDGQWTTEATFGLEPDWFADKVEVKPSISQKGLVPSIQGLQIGIVTNLEDPVGENRVQIKLPVVSNMEEGIWARIATLDAGADRGTFFLPEIDDEVIVGFINNDPSHAVILGMVHSSAKPAPFSAANANNQKGYVSRQQIKMVFNDEEKSFVLETPAGNKITLNEQDSLVKIEDQNGNTITMESAGVTIESATSITLKAATDLTVEAVNVTISPSASFAVGAAGCEIKAGSGSASISAPTVKVEGSGMTEIKGGLVKIN